MEQVLARHGIPYRMLSSGAIHDAMHMAACVPTSLLFVRSKDGVSHSPFEWSDREDIGLGIKVLTETILELDGSPVKPKEYL
jgi:acetylornithine deacetylase/succinyl-diaminopimelate desuccinylase-like protein